MDDLSNIKPVACTLTPAAQRAEIRRFKTDLGPHVLTRERLDDGARLTFAAVPGLREKIDLLVELDRGCCTFLEHEVESNEKTVTLTVRSQGQGIALAQGFLKELAPRKQGRALGVNSKLAALAGVGGLACVAPFILGALSLGVTGIGVNAFEVEVATLGLAAMATMAYVYYRKRNNRLKEKEANADRCSC